MPFRRHGLLPLLLVAATSGPAAGQGFTPEQALARMQVPDGFRVRLVAAEPVVRQPVTMSFDDRGRIWVIQYLQYPTPAGLKPVKIDQYLRTTYDRVPEPPPHGPRGADRITILEDTDAHGRYRRGRDFVTGLNLASGLCLGHGGVFVLQAPYLLFYPDRDGDGVPDGPPEVLLSGFGMEDAHAVANSLQWGPDGWLYGAQGSTVTARVRGIEFQQGIWRYHPRTRQFELFAEGGGNTWGLDFDRRGNAIAGTNWGGFAMLHQVQGGYYVKGFSKHGPLHNPHAYGYFDHVPCQGFHGGHVTCGGIVHEGDAYPEPFRGAYIAGNLLSNSLYWYTLQRRGSTFTSRHAGDFLLAHDTWFRPVDCLVGPDGCVYVADWYDKRANHVDPVDTWDRSNGRIYKVEYRDTRPPAHLPLSARSSAELVDLLAHPNHWYACEARRILAERRDRSVIPRLRAAALREKGPLALESLWALYVSGGFDEALAGRLLDHANEDVRAWTVRLLGDDRKLSPAIRDHLAGLARRESSPVVRCQLACSAKRLCGPDCLAIVRGLLTHDEDVADPFIPLLLWWAIEDKAVTDRAAVLAMLDGPAAWRRPLVRQFLIERLSRRYAAEGTDVGLETNARLLQSAPSPAERQLVLAGLEQALEGRLLARVPSALADQLRRLGRAHPGDLRLLRLAVRTGEAAAYDELLRRVTDPQTADGDRVALLGLLAQVGKPGCVPVLLGVLEQAKTPNVLAAALQALQAFADPAVAVRVLAVYPRLSPELRARARALLASRPGSARLLIDAVGAGKVDPREIPLDQLQQMAAYRDPLLRARIEKRWGRVGPATAGEKLARVNSILHILNQGQGDLANGRLLFQKHCAICHTLFGEGAKVGPDLTAAERKNRAYLVAQVVDPSAYVRPEYVAYNVETRDGRQLTGLVVESSAGAVTLLDARNERSVIPRDRIEDMTPSAVSLMPEKLLDALSDPELRDLFRYLQGDGPRK
jgi:putative membrane-bound dehydrogenase-like protein